ncbi:Beta-xylosidase, GH43 family [Paenibacillus sp. UNCCL117]|uniref:family 43 glycosylhydrolase n=1 Tax=unclassified Paenibacillus TaxID=185978 RepID=UPI0008856592|nr:MULTISPECIES: family 43 glycosylhydrolase [unclassified Paenibacillus]SDE40574.1 Beta-xylosidase, GH43 family [Paenibacillus sp. cl123]SFW65363.1 Beta-xylosidase, GH43 family [Paenibacillus sp. UNCCL117]
MVRNKFRHLLLCLAVLLMLPQWSGLVGAAEPSPGSADAIPSFAQEGKNVSDFYNVIMQTGADPWVYKHTDGYYYNVFANASGVVIRRAKTISGLEAGERRLAWSPVKGTMYSSNIWAPEMHYLKDTDGQFKWYIYVAADNGTNANHRMYVLENASANPLTGTWEFKGKITDPSDRWAIDGTVLTVGEQHYFIWSGWEETDGSFQNLYIAEMSDPRTISSERVLLSTSEYDWESSPARINEGPQVTVKGDTINLVYSANGSWTDSYCLGLITAKIGDDLMNPDSWVKKDKPIFSSANGVYGPGHHSIVTSPDGTEDWIIYHAARWPGSGWTRKVHTQKFTWNSDNTPNLGEPADPNIPIATPSGEPVRKRYEAENALLVKAPGGEASPAVRREATASGGMKIANIKNADDYAQFTVNVPETGFYMLAVRNANGSPNAADASHILSINGSSGINLSIVYSGVNRWGLSSAKVYLKEGDNILRFSKGNNLAEIDSLDLFKLDATEMLFAAPGYTLGLGETHSLPLYTVTGTTYTAVEAGATFTSSDTKIAAIDGGGGVKAVGAGSATITATYNGKTATATVTVAAEPKAVQSVAVGGLDRILTSGQSSGPLQVMANYNNYEVQNVTAAAQYTSSDPEVAGIDSVTHAVYAVKPGTASITAEYNGKKTALSLAVIAASDAVQVATQVKTPSGVAPKLPSVVDVVYNSQSKKAEVVSWEPEGLDFYSLGTVQLPVILKLDGREFPSTVSVNVIPGWGLDEIVNQLRSKLVNFSYPLGDGLGNYSQSKYDAFAAEVNKAEELAGNADLSKEQFNEQLDKLAQAEAALLGSLNSVQDGVVYNAYRDFSGDTIGKYPYGITTEDLTNGASATVQEEAGNRFLRVTTTATSGKANLFLPYAGEVRAEADERIVIEYRARLNTNFQYANGAMVRNDSGTGNYSLVTAFDMGKIIVQNGPSTKVKVQDFQYNTWYKIKMVANWDAKTYTVYINDVEVATDYNFRHTGGEKLAGQRFGVDGYANASIDFDDFKAMVIGGPKAAPTGLNHTNETAVGANDGRITGVNSSMEWSSDNGSTWLSVEGDAIANLSPGTYWVRYAQTDTHKASPHVALTIAVYTPPVLVTSVSLNQTAAQLYTNHGASTVQLTADVKPADAANKTVTWSSSNPAVATVDEHGLVTVHAAGSAVITVATEDGGYTASCVVTVSVYNNDNGGGDTSSGGSDPAVPTKPSAPSTEVKNKDGSTTVSSTDQTTGTVTETTVWPNGDREVRTKERNGTITEVVTKQDGSKRETVSKPDGSSRSVTTDAKGVQVETVTTALGAVTAAIHLPEGVTQARVTVPFKNASASTVAFAVRENGTKEVIGTVVTEAGLSFTAKGNMTVKLIDNKVVFQDVPDSHWAAEAIAFTASREWLLGTEPGTFAPGVSVSRAMLFTVLARVHGVETEGGEYWYSKAADWAVASEISDGSNPEASMTREQLITVLHRYAEQPAASGNGISFADGGQVSAWANDAIDWAVSAGILTGKPGNLLEPAGAVTRAEVSAMLARFIAWRSN